MTSKLERHAEHLSALGHPVRLKVLRFVVQAGADGSAAGDIQAHVDLPASTLSHHLKRLVSAAVVTMRGEGTFHYYTADYDALRTLTVAKPCSKPSSIANIRRFCTAPVPREKSPPSPANCSNWQGDIDVLLESAIGACKC